MKKVFLALIALYIAQLACAGFLYVLSETYPLHPGQKLYALQDTAEQIRLSVARDPHERLDLALVYVERRIGDLARADTPIRLDAAVVALDLALDQAVKSVNGLPKSEQEAGYAAFRPVLVRAEAVIRSLEKLDLDAHLAALKGKVAYLDAIEKAGKTAELQPAPGRTFALVDALRIPFLGQEVEHMILPLTGKHRELACDSCHADGAYASTTVECAACHSLPQDIAHTRSLRVQNRYVQYARTGKLTARQIYPDHFTGDCSDCHSLWNWQPEDFDHEGVIECRSCHMEDLTALARYSGNPLAWYANPEPAAHYELECSLCHFSVGSWEQIDYGHQEAGACEDCHEAETPKAHFSGACADCHIDMGDWKEAYFNHSGYTDCASCHAVNAPAGHYSGACSSCHNTSDWLHASFQHSSSDNNCRRCHDRPRQHWSGQCSECHTTIDWRRLNFDHKITANCTECHTTPASHYTAEGGCSDCHSSSMWEAVTYSHDDGQLCANCHLADEPAGHYHDLCETCHATTDWVVTTFDHTTLSDCISCHSLPEGHYEGQCSNCHTTENWTAYQFDHTGFTDCLSCHSAPREHYEGQCSNCHTTLNWEAAFFDHSGYTDCLACHVPPAGHYTEQCSNCHTTDTWETVYNHTGLTDCLACHTAPSGHWPGECLNCHNTESWLDVTFDHTTYTDCKACHERPAGHPRGQCSRCHTTDTWLIEEPTPTPYGATAAPTDTPTPLPTELKATNTPKSTPIGGPTSTATSPPVDTSTPVPVLFPVQPTNPVHKIDPTREPIMVPTEEPTSLPLPIITRIAITTEPLPTDEPAEPLSTPTPPKTSPPVEPDPPTLEATATPAAKIVTKVPVYTQPALVEKVTPFVEDTPDVPEEPDSELNLSTPVTDKEPLPVDENAVSLPDQPPAPLPPPAPEEVLAATPAPSLPDQSELALSTNLLMASNPPGAHWSFFSHWLDRLTHFLR